MNGKAVVALKWPFTRQLRRPRGDARAQLQVEAVHHRIARHKNPATVGRDGAGLAHGIDGEFADGSALAKADDAVLHVVGDQQLARTLDERGYDWVREEAASG